MYLIVIKHKNLIEKIFWAKKKEADRLFFSLVKFLDYNE